MQNTWKIFSKAMKKIGVSLKEFRVHALRDGDPTECTRLLRLVLMGISLEVAEQMLSRGLGQLSSDNKFVNTAFRYLREQSAYIPVITTTQYHSKGYGEHKLLLINAAANHVMGYLALGGPRVPNDLYLPDPDNFSSPLHDYDSPIPNSEESNKHSSRVKLSPNPLSSIQESSSEQHRYNNNLIKSIQQQTQNTPLISTNSLSTSSSSPSSPMFSSQLYQPINSTTTPNNTPHTPPLPHTYSHRPLHEEPDPSPNYRRAYLVEDPNSNYLTREECMAYIQNIEKKLRREYDASLFVLSNRVKTLENDLLQLKQSNSYLSHAVNSPDTINQQNNDRR